MSLSPVRTFDVHVQGVKPVQRFSRSIFGWVEKGEEPEQDQV